MILSLMRVGMDWDLVLRVLLAACAGMILGWERERHGRAAGLRTTMMVSLGASLVMVISEVFYRESFLNPNATWHPDPARFGAGVLSGMGFLGAGVIIHEANHITRGVTTAATLWCASIIGLSFGGGLWIMGVVGTALACLILFILPLMEHHIDNDWYSDFTVQIDRAKADQDAIDAIVKSADVKIKQIDWDEDIASGTRTLVYHLRFKKSRNKEIPHFLIHKISPMDGVRNLKWQD